MNELDATNNKGSHIIMCSKKRATELLELEEHFQQLFLKAEHSILENWMLEVLSIENRYLRSKLKEACDSNEKLKERIKYLSNEVDKYRCKPDHLIK